MCAASCNSRGLIFEDRTHHAEKLTAAHANRAEAGDGLAGRRMAQDRILDLRRYPHAAARTVLLKVTFIQAPQFDVAASGQMAEFFLLPRLLADPIERLGGAAFASESPLTQLAEDYDTSPQQIEEALRCELERKAA